MKNRHAYLIMCHTNFDQLNVLLKLLDDERNDIYLHIDKKAKGYSIKEIEKHVRSANLFMIKPMYVTWGGDSQIKLEMKLLLEATKTQHSYYHLISGMDLPLKSQNDIHDFFSQNSGYDYVSLERNRPHNLSKSYMDRLNYYYLFQNHIKRGEGGVFYKIQRIALIFQKRIKICRTINAKIEFQKGSNWFSITHATAAYVINEYKKYKKYFRFTLCADEVFLQTILINSPQINNIIDDDLRYIDWERGRPYIFKKEDYDLLIHSGELFARKFDVTVDEEIVKKIYNSIDEKE